VNNGTLSLRLSPCLFQTPQNANLFKCASLNQEKWKWDDA
jgi:hypothetical protein